MQFHLGYVTETIWNHNFYLPLVCHLTSDLKVFIVYTRRSKCEKVASWRKWRLKFCLHYMLSHVVTQTRAFDRKGETTHLLISLVSSMFSVPWKIFFFDMSHHTWSISCACYTIIGTVFNHYDMNVLRHAKLTVWFTPRPGSWYQSSTTMQKCIKHAQGELILLITNPSSRHWFSIR